MNNVYHNSEYTTTAEKRKLALIESLKQTREIVKRRFSEKHPELPDWYIEILFNLAWHRIQI